MRHTGKNTTGLTKKGGARVPLISILINNVITKYNYIYLVFVMISIVICYNNIYTKYI